MYAFTITDEWRFIGYRGSKPPSQKGWLSNIKAMRCLWLHIRNISKMEYLKTRSINQDAIENMFGGIRGYCGSNTNPTSLQFVQCLKTHIINGLTNKGIQNTNCEIDNGELLTDLLTYLKPSIRLSPPSSTTTAQSTYVQSRQEPDIDLDLQEFNFDMMLLGSADVYIAGYIAKKLLMTPSCSVCSELLTTSEHIWANDFISFKEYDGEIAKKLVYPSKHLVSDLSNISKVIEAYLQNSAHTGGIMSTLKVNVKAEINFSWFNCAAHSTVVFDKLIAALSLLCIRWFCTRKNREFRFSQQKKSKKVQILQHE